MNSVIMPLEESINGVENMMYITSTASNSGLAIIQVYFKQGTDPDMAAVNVQNRVAKAQGLLPAEVTKIGVSTQKRQTIEFELNSILVEKSSRLVLWSAMTGVMIRRSLPIIWTSMYYLKSNA